MKNAILYYNSIKNKFIFRKNIESNIQRLLKSTLYKICILILPIFLSLVNPAFAETTTSDIILYLNGNIFYSSCPIIVENGTALAPFREIADTFGASTSWDSSSETITSTLNEVTVQFKIGSNVMIKYGKPVEMGAETCYYGNTAMVPVKAIGDAFGYPVTWDERNRVIFLGDVVNINVNPMNNVKVTDEFRYNNYIGEYSGVSIFSNGNENFGMELLGINDYWGSSYAETIAKIADCVPYANVYNIIVPTAQEFYASNSKKTNQTAEISNVYEHMIQYNKKNLKPINIVQTLSDHAAEKIYFCTDHHWTQRGAYYAYQKYALENKSISEIDPLNTFEVQNIYGYYGSLCSFTSGTYGNQLLAQNPDMLQLFSPKSSSEGAAYRDPFMRSYIQSIKVIYPPDKSYSCFIEGDYPLEVFKTNVNNGKKICIIKDSFGDAFATWAVNNYEEVYVIDYRMFNGGTYGDYGSGKNDFKISDFYNFVKFDDLVIISYPVTVSTGSSVQLLTKMVN